MNSEILPIYSGLGQDGRLEIGGCAVENLAREYGTPVMVGSAADLKDQASSILEAFRRRHARSDVYFASKAMPSPAVIGILSDQGLGCDVSSEGELAFALAGGVPAERILLHGNAKRDRDISAAVEAGVGLVVVDSLDELDRLERIVTAPQSVLVRVNPGVGAPTHSSMNTGDGSSKFGLSDDDLFRAIERIETSPVLEMEGLHVHIGSQIGELQPFADGVASLAGRRNYGTFDFGGGLGVRYLPDDPRFPTLDEWAETVVSAAHRELGEDFRLIVEPGRSIVARAFVTVYTVVSVKFGVERTVVAVDGGMGDNLERQLYQTKFAPFVLDRAGSEEPCDIVGPHCETGDRLVERFDLTIPEVDERIVVPVTGAYCASLANNYNSYGRPAMVLCESGDARLVTRRESPQELLRRHVLPVKSRAGGMAR